MPSRHEESQIQIQNQVLESLKSLPSKIQQGWKLFYCIKQNFDVSFFLNTAIIKTREWRRLAEEASEAYTNEMMLMSKL